MSNSNLVTHVNLSPHHSGTRTKAIDRITPHCVVGQCTIEGLGEWFKKPSTKASSNYGIDKDGKIGMFVEEGFRSWCSSSHENDQRAVTIECASEPKEPYAFREVVYNTLINLCVDICLRNNKKKLLWISNKDAALNYKQAPDEMLLTVHRWFANKSCPGDWLFNRLSDVATQVTNRLSSISDAIPEIIVVPDPPIPTNNTSTKTQATSLNALSSEDVIKFIGPLLTADMQKTGVLASVTGAQFILESGYGKSELAQMANNCFGMKKNLSGNTWAGSTWDGASVYTKQSSERNEKGEYYTATSDFRKYSCIEDSLEDHSAYLLGAMNGKNLRYAGLRGETNPLKAIQIISNGGYAGNDPNGVYVNKIVNLIQKWDLTRFDKPATPSTPTGASSTPENPAFPYLVRITATVLSVSGGPGSDYQSTGIIRGGGVYTIIAEADGKGAHRWGKLKSGMGWIPLEFTSLYTERS